MRAAVIGMPFTCVPVPASPDAAVTERPIPRIASEPDALKFVLVKLTLGTLNWRSITSLMLMLSRPSPLKAVIAIGMSWTDSSRLRAVTVISSMPPGATTAASCSSSCAGSAAAASGMASSPGSSARVEGAYASSTTATSGASAILSQSILVIAHPSGRGRARSSQAAAIPQDFPQTAPRFPKPDRKALKVVKSSIFTSPRGRAASLRSGPPRVGWAR